METAHHMLLYGCEEPGSDEEVWYDDFKYFFKESKSKLLYSFRNCGEMAVKDPSLKSAEPCKKGAQVS
jgi:hypothetical protein